MKVSRRTVLKSLAAAPMLTFKRVDIAFVADNPGNWMLHCHILAHQHGGMMTIFRVT